MDITAQIAARVTSSRLEEIPADVRHEARRALLNFVGCAIGGASEESVVIALRALSPYSGSRTAGVLGRSERLDPLMASLINGIASHVHDFDDTTPHNLSHTTSPVASAIVSYASHNAVSGCDFVHAFILGFETASRIANAIFPGHYDAGWHITSTVGVIGAAVAIGRLRGFSAEQTANAIGIAATQSAGLRVVFGSMAKGYNPGRAAQGGYVAALLADEGFTGGSDPLGGARGFLEVLSPEWDISAIIGRSGTDFELRRNTYKPFPCGLVIHPTIDACIQVHYDEGIAPDEIGSVRLKVAPIVLDLCNKKAISTGLESKFSVYHAAALGLVRGKAGLAEFTDEAVGDPVIRAVRERVTAEGDSAVPQDSVIVEITRRNGERVARTVRHAIGTLKQPMSDRALEEKFRGQAQDVLSSDRIEALIDLCWQIEDAGDAGRISALAVPTPVA